MGEVKKHILHNTYLSIVYTQLYGVQSCTGANVKQFVASKEYLLFSSLLFELNDLAKGDLGGVYLGRQ